MDDRFVMFVIPGDRKLDSKRVRQALSIHALRFATPEELRQLMGLPPGAVPPFGSLFGLPTHCDATLRGLPIAGLDRHDPLMVWAIAAR